MRSILGRWPGSGGDENFTAGARRTRRECAPTAARATASSTADAPAPTTVTSRPAKRLTSWWALACVTRDSGRRPNTAGR